MRHRRDNRLRLVFTKVEGDLCGEISKALVINARNRRRRGERHLIVFVFSFILRHNLIKNAIKTFECGKCRIGTAQFAGGVAEWSKALCLGRNLNEAWVQIPPPSHEVWSESSIILSNL